MRPVRTLVLAVLFALPGAEAARAVAPSDKHSALPASLGIPWSAVSFASTRDHADLHGWWFEGKPESPVLVLFDREQGSMGDLLPVAREFVTRGFTVMTFDYRDWGPGGPGPVDSLAQLAYASRWVNDAEGALQFARARSGGRPVFAWGQGLGGAIAVAAAGRLRTNADAVACEGLFRTLPELLRASGLAQVPGVAKRHRFLVETSDEPITAVSGLVVPLHVVLAGRDEVWPSPVTQEVVRRSLSRIDRWVLPDAGHTGVENTPGYYDRLAGWYTRLAGLIKATKAAEAGAK